MLSIEQLSDRAEISHVIHRMAWCQDQRDWKGLADVLAETIDLDYSPGTDGLVTGVARADVVASWREASERIDASQHVLTDFQISVTDDTAEVGLNEQVWLTRSAAEGSRLYNFGTAMRLRLERFPVGWRITSLSVRGLWSDGNAAVLGGYTFARP